MKLLIVTLFLMSNVFGGIEQAPKDFKHQGKRVVFVDFLRAQYDLHYEADKRKASAVSTIEFVMPNEGYPLFDSVSSPIWIKLNGEEVHDRKIKTPGPGSWVRMIDKKLPKGTHTVQIRTLINKGTVFKKRKRRWSRVSSGFFIRDLTDRKFLEQYLPTNMEYDQYKMEMDVKVTGTKRHHSLFANGDVTKITNNHYRVSFPEWYTTSSVYFHLVPINKFVRWYLKYKSIDGREIPVTIYSRWRFYNYFTKKKTWKVMRELERDYGPYPHDKLIIYGTGIKGGMEHAGATETSIKSLGHELQHMYFAKCIHPANGNSGWLDEAIASWRDKGHKSKKRPFFKSVNLAAHSTYTRKTDRRSYKYGRSFMAYINYQLKAAGKPGLKDFLRVYFDKRKYTTVTTQDFIDDLEEYAGFSFGDDFHQYIYGGVKSEKGLHNHDHLDVEENHHHPERSEKEMNSII